MNLDNIIKYLLICVLMFTSFTFGLMFNITRKKSDPLLTYNNATLISGELIQDYLSYTLDHYVVYDNMYTTIDIEYMEYFLKQDNLNSYKYKIDKFDCDNFAIILMSRLLELNYNLDISYNFAIGVCNQQLHVINWFIDTNLTVRCIEPQNDTIFFCDVGKICNSVFI